MASVDDGYFPWVAGLQKSSGFSFKQKLICLLSQKSQKVLLYLKACITEREGIYQNFFHSVIIVYIFFFLSQHCKVQHYHIPAKVPLFPVQKSCQCFFSFYCITSGKSISKLAGVTGTGQWKQGTMWCPFDFIFCLKNNVPLVWGCVVTCVTRNEREEITEEVVDTVALQRTESCPLTFCRISTVPLKYDLG